MSAPAARPDRRALWGTYAVGLFGMGYIDVFTFLIPLYALAVGLDPAEIGALVGARTVLALFFSIHVGTMMDRFGSVRVTQCCTVIAMVLAPVYPLVDGFWGLLILQIVVGGMVSFGWAGGQTMIAQLTAGDAEYIGRFSFASRIGTATAPLIAGAVWDFGGVWPAYLLCAVWGVVLMAALAFAPTWPVGDVDGHPAATAFAPRDLLPRVSDYIHSFAMMAIPVIAITAAVMALRNSTSGIQNSIYMVYLEGIGIGAFEIGILFAAIEGASGLGSLLGGRAMRLGDPQWTLVIGTAIAIFAIVITPLLIWASPGLAVAFALLVSAQVVRGAIQGVMQPVMFSVQSRTVGPYEQGAVVGLRQTVNRASAILVPPVMGLIAKYWGIAESFLILGAGLLFFCLVVAIWIHRSPPFEG